MEHQDTAGIQESADIVAIAALLVTQGILAYLATVDTLGLV
jgi:hypothetical protein